jgi:ankyrin repeat protein
MPKSPKTQYTAKETSAIAALTKTAIEGDEDGFKAKLSEQDRIIQPEVARSLLKDILDLPTRQDGHIAIIRKILARIDYSTDTINLLDNSDLKKLALLLANNNDIPQLKKFGTWLITKLFLEEVNNCPQWNEELETYLVILLKLGATVNATYKGSKHEYTPLIRAVKKGMPELVKLLCEYGANKEQTDKNGKNALQHAADEVPPPADIVEILDKTKTLDSGYLKACTKGDLARFKELVDRVKDPYNVTVDGKSSTTLSYLYKIKPRTTDHYAIEALLIQKGAEIEYEDTKLVRTFVKHTIECPSPEGKEAGIKALMAKMTNSAFTAKLKPGDYNLIIRYALESSNLPLLALAKPNLKNYTTSLIQANASAPGEELKRQLDLLEKAGVTLADYAKYAGSHKNFKSYLLRARNSTTEYILACQNGDFEAFKASFDATPYPIYISEAGKEKKPTLQVVLENADPENPGYYLIAKHLISCFEESAIRLNFVLYCKLLTMAIKAGDLAIVNLLCKNTRHLEDLKDEDKINIIAFALKEKNIEILKAISSIEKRHLTTYFFKLIEECNELSNSLTSALDLLLRNGVLINSAQDDNNKETPLIKASRMGKTELVDFLLNKGADPCICHKDTNTTAFDVASNAATRELLTQAVIDFIKLDPYYIAYSGNYKKFKELAKKFSAKLREPIKKQSGKTSSMLEICLSAPNLTENHYAIIRSLIYDINLPLSKQSKEALTKLAEAAVKFNDQLTIAALYQAAVLLKFDCSSSMHEMLLSFVLKQNNFIIFRNLASTPKYRQGLQDFFCKYIKTLGQNNWNNNIQQALEVMMSLGADITALDKSLITPLGHACFAGNTKLVEFFLSKLALSYTAANPINLTPSLTSAIKGKQFIITQTIIKQKFATIETPVFEVAIRLKDLAAIICILGNIPVSKIYENKNDLFADIDKISFKDDLLVSLDKSTLEDLVKLATSEDLPQFITKLKTNATQTNLIKICLAQCLQYFASVELAEQSLTDYLRAFNELITDHKNPFEGIELEELRQLLKKVVLSSINHDLQTNILFKAFANPNGKNILTSMFVDCLKNPGQSKEQITKFIASLQAIGFDLNQHFLGFSALACALNRKSYIVAAQMVRQGVVFTDLAVEALEVFIINANLDEEVLKTLAEKPQGLSAIFSAMHKSEDITKFANLKKVAIEAIAMGTKILEPLGLEKFIDSETENTICSTANGLEAIINIIILHNKAGTTPVQNFSLMAISAIKNGAPISDIEHNLLSEFMTTTELDDEALTTVVTKTQCLGAVLAAIAITPKMTAKHALLTSVALNAISTGVAVSGNIDINNLATFITDAKPNEATLAKIAQVPHGLAALAIACSTAPQSADRSNYTTALMNALSQKPAPEVSTTYPVAALLVTSQLQNVDRA